MNAQKTVFAVLLAATVGATMAGSAATTSQSSLRAEKIVSFKTTGQQTIGAVVGPVKVDGVRFTDRGRPAGLPLIGRVSDLSTTLRASFDVENPKAEGWTVKFILEFLDRDGKIIDRGEKSGDFEGEAKIFDMDHVILSYAVPYIDRVRVRLEAELD